MGNLSRPALSPCSPATALGDPTRPDGRQAGLWVRRAARATAGVRGRRLLPGLVATSLVGAGFLGGAGVAGAAAATGHGGAAAVGFVPIREVFDGHRVARPRPAAATCKTATSTLQLVTCNEYRTENVDVQINTVRAQQFATAGSDAARRAINADDAAWLAKRSRVCQVSYPAQGGGTIGQIVVSGCETDVSHARLDFLQGRPVPTAHLVATDDPNPHATQYATTGTGSLVGAIDTQGDQTGGVVIAWVVIAGYKGFTVRPASFTFVDGAFTDKGIVSGHPGGHRIAPGHEYVFDIDYSTLPKDPNASKGTGRYEYRSAGHLVATWK